MPASRLSVRQHPGFNHQMGFLGYGYVFYDRLLQDSEDYNAPKLGELWRKMNDSIIQIAWGESGKENKKRIRSEAAKQLRLMANAEKEKEKRIIKTQLGIDIDYDLSDKGAIKNFLESLSACVGLREHHLRNIERIVKGNKKQVSLSKFIVTYAGKGYFNKHLEEEFTKPAFIKALKKAIKSKDVSKLHKAINTAYDKVLKTTINEMFNSKVLNGEKNIDPFLDGTYLPLLEKLEQDSDYRKSFYGRLAKMLKVDEIRDTFENAMLNATDIDEAVEKTVKAIEIRGEGVGKIQGEMEELLVEAIVKAFSSGFMVNNDSFTVNIAPEVGKRGEYEQKTDVYITVGVPMSVIDNSISHKKISREKAMEDARNLSEKLKELDGGFVVNENAKNYTLDSGRFREDGGFSAGAFSGAGGLNFLRELYKRLGKTVEARQIFNGIKNLGKGTIGEGDDQLEQLLEDSLGADVAYALFDDYDAIGTIANSGAQQLHIFDLNGIQIPLSFYLSLLAETFERIANNLDETAEELVKVDIKPAPAIYADLPFYSYGILSEMNRNLWKEQRDYSDANSLIDVHFFKSFSQIVKEYLGDMQ